MLIHRATSFLCESKSTNRRCAEVSTAQARNPTMTRGRLDCRLRSNPARRESFLSSPTKAAEVERSTRSDSFERPLPIRRRYIRCTANFNTVSAITRSKPGRRIDPVACEFFKQPHDLGLARERTLEHRCQVEFVDTDVAITLEIVRGCRCGRRDREFEGFGLPAVGREQLPQTIDRLRGFLGCQIEPAPSRAIRGGPFQRSFGLSTDEDRHFRAAHGFRITQRAVEFHELAAVTALLSPQASHRLDILARAPRTVFPRYPERLELFLQPSNPDSQGQPSAAQIVERRTNLGEQQRIVLRDETNPGRKPDAAGARSRIGQREKRIKQRSVG